MTWTLIKNVFLYIFARPINMRILLIYIEIVKWIQSHNFTAMTLLLWYQIETLVTNSPNNWNSWFIYTFNKGKNFWNQKSYVIPQRALWFFESCSPLWQISVIFLMSCLLLRVQLNFLQDFNFFVISYLPNYYF